jgi:membrane protein DedA with SNARE-associated domain
MQPSSFVQIIDWVSAHSYFFVFLAMVVEGPIVTTAAAFASALGFFNLFIILTLSIAADLIADGLYYLIGFWGRINLIERYGSKVGFTPKRVERLEKLIQKHTLKALIAIKATPTLATPGLIIAGASKVPPKRYISISLGMTVPKSLLFVAIGFYSGKAHSLANKYLHYGKYAVPLTVVGLFLITYLYQKASKFLAQKIEKV